MMMPIAAPRRAAIGKGPAPAEAFRGLGTGRRHGTSQVPSEVARVLHGLPAGLLITG